MLGDNFDNKLFSYWIYWPTTGRWKREDINADEVQDDQREKERERERGYKGETNEKVKGWFPRV